MKRCFWVDENSELYVKYHDEEWGVPKYDDRELLELLILESFQAGLSWITVLKKREAFRKGFDNFDINKIIKYDDKKVAQLMNNEGIIRCKNKIISAINNAKIFKEIQKEYGSFSNYIWGFTDKKVIKRTAKELPVSTPYPTGFQKTSKNEE